MQKLQKIVLIMIFFCIFLLLSLILFIGYFSEKNIKEGNGRHANIDDIKIEILLDNDTMIINQTSINLTIIVTNLVDERIFISGSFYFSIQNINNSKINITHVKKITDDMVMVLEPKEQNIFLRGEINTNDLYKDVEPSPTEIIGEYKIIFGFGEGFYGKFHAEKNFWVEG